MPVLWCESGQESARSLAAILRPATGNAQLEFADLWRAAVGSRGPLRRGA